MKFRAALGFFTRLPVGSAPLPPTFQGVIVWLPAIGLIVGLLAALAVALATLLLPAQLGGVIGCLVWVFITGGLHLDGVADCGDGLLVEAPPERRLEIMKDSRLGTFGGAALFFVLALKATALCTLAASFDGSWSGLLTLAGACCMAGALARSMVFPAMHIPSARPGGLGAALHPGGLGAALHNGVTRRHDMLALGIGLGICALNGGRGFTALIAALLVAWLLLSAAQKRLGGVTGDVFGCLIELTESAVLVACCLR